MGLARAAHLPVIVAGDIDRGGVFAAMYGTLALLDQADQELVAGFVINKFRGAPELLDSGLEMLRGLTGRPMLGVLPFTEGLWLDVEDSLSLDLARRPAAVAPHGTDLLRVSVIRLPRISNVTDIDALSAEPGVLVRFAATPAELADADLVVLPGTRATVDDLNWLRQRGLADALTSRADRRRPVLGICGGYQMLGREIDDTVESGAGTVPGLGLLPVRVSFGPGKQLGRPAGSAYPRPWRGMRSITESRRSRTPGCRSSARPARLRRRDHDPSAGRPKAAGCSQRATATTVPAFGEPGVCTP
jgi:adenosylcobyric acid synthase